MFNPRGSGQAEQRGEEEQEEEEGCTVRTPRPPNPYLSDPGGGVIGMSKGPLYTCQALTPRLSSLLSLLVRVPTLSSQQFPLAYFSHTHTHRGGSLGLKPPLLTAEQAAGYLLDRLCGWMVPDRFMELLHPLDTHYSSINR